MSESIKTEVARIRKEMCCEPHPAMALLCMRNSGHDGEHWAQHRWTREGALADAARFKARFQEPTT